MKTHIDHWIKRSCKLWWSRGNASRFLWRLTTNFTQNQCKEQSSEMLERACLAVESAAKGGGVYPEVLFCVARCWHELHEQHLPSLRHASSAGVRLSGASGGRHLQPCTLEQPPPPIPLQQVIGSKASKLYRPVRAGLIRNETIIRRIMQSMMNYF